MKTSSWILALLLGVSSLAQANSWVGNGGSSGDVELAVTLMQIQETFNVIQSHADAHPALCTCNSMYSRSGLCEPLKALDEKQAAVCSEGLYKQAPEILELVRNRDNLRVRWTDSPIEVMEGGQPRAADAVANRQTREITINQRSFRGMLPAERVFLLTHELMHLTKYDGKPLTDEGEVGPFHSESGSRNFINAMAAGASVLQGEYPAQIKSYRAKLHRSQALKHFWFTGDVGGVWHDNKSDGIYGFQNYFSAGGTARYQWDHFGVYLGYHNVHQSKKTLETIDTVEDINTWSLGGTYRIFFSPDPLSYWGQSHLLTYASLDHVRATFKTVEYVSGAGEHLIDMQQTDTLGGTAGVAFYIPLFWGLWTFAGTEVQYRDYKYNSFDVKYNPVNFSTYGGVSYAF